jgi:hypothetical protein
MWARALLLVVVSMLIGQASGHSAPAAPYPEDFKTTWVKYAVVDRSDGMSRDLYVSPDALEALKRDPQLREFPVGAELAVHVHSARLLGRDGKTHAPIFEAAPDGHLIRSKDERTVHLMRKMHPGSGSQNWAFGGFDPLTGESLNLQLPGDCLLCHQAAVVSDMAFSMTLLKRFAATGVAQYRFCSHPGRQACAF